jgi:hypothetical protein
MTFLSGRERPGSGLHTVIAGEQGGEVIHATPKNHRAVLASVLEVKLAEQPSQGTQGAAVVGSGQGTNAGPRRTTGGLTRRFAAGSEEADEAALVVGTATQVPGHAPPAAGHGWEHAVKTGESRPEVSPKRVK